MLLWEVYMKPPPEKSQYACIRVRLNRWHAPPLIRSIARTWPGASRADLDDRLWAGGACGGAGFSLAMACDMIIATDDAVFTLAYSVLGTSPDGSSTYTLPRLIGYHRAMELVLLSDRFGSDRAKELGLINFIVPKAELKAETEKLSKRVASGPTLAYGRAKALISKSLERGIGDQLDAEAQNIMECSRTADFAEGVNAFLDKRKPVFTGR